MAGSRERVRTVMSSSWPKALAESAMKSAEDLMISAVRSKPKSSPEEAPVRFDDAIGDEGELLAGREGVDGFGVGGVRREAEGEAVVDGDLNAVEVGREMAGVGGGDGAAGCDVEDEAGGEASGRAADEAVVELCVRMAAGLGRGFGCGVERAYQQRKR